MAEGHEIPGYDCEIEIVEYDPEWPARFEREAERIEDAVSEPARVEHLGSTAVPELAAKPIVDLGLILADQEAVHDAIEALQRVGYHSQRERDGWFELLRWADDGLLFKAGVCSRDLERWRRNVAFREYLRDHPDAREGYADVKRRAAAEHPSDPSAYNDAKADTIESIVRRAREAGYEEQVADAAIFD